MAALGGCAALLLTACGDDAGASDTAACDPYLAVNAQFSGEPDPATLEPLLDELDENAPEDLTEPLAVDDGRRSQGPGQR